MLSRSTPNTDSLIRLLMSIRSGPSAHTSPRIKTEFVFGAE